MSIRVLPAALLPSGDKVVSPLAGACWWVVKLSIGFFFLRHTYTQSVYVLLGSNVGVIFVSKSKWN